MNKIVLVVYPRKKDWAENNGVYFNADFASGLQYVSEVISRAAFIKAANDYYGYCLYMDGICIASAHGSDKG